MQNNDETNEHEEARIKWQKRMKHAI